MANLQYASDIISDALWRAGEPTSGGDYQAKALDYLNRAYQAIYLGGQEILPDFHEDWWWLRKHPPGVLNLVPKITITGVSLVNDAVTVTLSSTVTPAQVGKFFRVQGLPEIYRVTAHASGSALLTLDSNLTCPTASGRTVELLGLEYDLASDVLCVLSPMRAFRSTGGGLGDYQIDGIDLQDLEVIYPLPDVQSGVPEYFSPVTETKIRFSRYWDSETPTEKLRLEYDYLYRPVVLTNTAMEPVIPWQFRKTLSDLTLSFLLIDKEDSRATGVLELVRSGLLAMARENKHKQANMSRAWGRLTTRPASLYRRPLRTESGLILG